MLAQSDTAPDSGLTFLPANVTVQVSWGELMDKIFILQIKQQRLKSPDAAANVRRELAILEDAGGKVGSMPPITALHNELKSVNEALWEIEDQIRAREAAQLFDAEFVRLARAVYFQNDKRGLLKRRINEITKSEIVEEKQYTSYHNEQSRQRDDAQEHEQVTKPGVPSQSSRPQGT